VVLDPRGGPRLWGGWDRGQADDSPLTADLTITVNNLDALLDDPSIRSDLGGTCVRHSSRPTHSQ
jgi:hypothetical protein